MSAPKLRAQQVKGISLTLTTSLIRNLVRFELFEKEVVIRNVKIKPLHLEVVVRPELNGSKTKPGLGMVPMYFPDVVMPVR